MQKREFDNSWWNRFISFATVTLSASAAGERTVLGTLASSGVSADEADAFLRGEDARALPGIADIVREYRRRL